jgi:hypothetical protein
MVLESDALASLHHTSARTHKQGAQGTALCPWRVGSGDAVAIEMGLWCTWYKISASGAPQRYHTRRTKAVNCGQLWIS